MPARAHEARAGGDSVRQWGLLRLLVAAGGLGVLALGLLRVGFRVAAVGHDMLLL